MPTPFTSKPSFGLSLTDVPAKELPCDLEDDDVEMVNTEVSCDQPRSPSLHISKCLLRHTQASQGSSAINRKFGKDSSDNPRILLLDKLVGSPSEFALSRDAHSSSNDAQGAHYTRKFKATKSAANASDETQGDGKNGRHLQRRGFCVAAADAMSGVSASEKKKEKKKGASASAEDMSQRGDHAEYGALSDLPLTKETSASVLAAGKLPVVWPENATTVMLRNLPNHYSAEELLAEIMEERFEGQMDFMYLPIDFETKRNIGYAFINFHTTSILRKFADIFDNRRPTRHATKKLFHVAPAARQGFEAHVIAFLSRKSRLILNPWFSPMILGRSDVVDEIKRQLNWYAAAK